MKWQGKKGFYWEVTPERRSSVEREVERYLRQEGKLKDIDHLDGSKFMMLQSVSQSKIRCCSCTYLHS